MRSALVIAVALLVSSLAALAAPPSELVLLVRKPAATVSRRRSGCGRCGRARRTEAFCVAFLSSQSGAKRFFAALASGIACAILR